jgi:hypothetical protein
MNVRFLRGAASTFVFVATLFGFTSAASAQDPDDLHLSGFLALGFGGEWNVDGGPITVDGDLDATVGFGLRLDVPLLEYLTVGGQIGFLFPKLDGVDSRESWIDLPDLIVRGRYPVRLGNGLLEPYVGFLIGGTISVLGEDDLKDTAYGWNVGLLFGAQYFFTDVIGALFELGWHRHAANHEGDLGDLDYSANQAAMNLGISVLF